MLKIVEGRTGVILIAIGYLLLAALLVGGIVFWSKSEIEVRLTRLVPRVLWVNILLILTGIVLCRQDLAAAFRRLFSGEEPRPGVAAAVRGKAGQPAQGEAAPCAAPAPETRHPFRYWPANRTGLWLMAVVALGLIAVTQIAPQTHRIYYDEDIYANMAQNIAHTGQTGMANYGTFEYGEYFLHWLLYNKDPSGWPFLMSLVFQLFGTDETYGFWLNNLLFAGGIVIVFWIVRLLGGAPFAALSAALIYALIPHNLLWANTLSAENPAAVLAGLTILCTLIWLRSRAPRHLFCLAAVLPLACNVRPESALIVLCPLLAAALNLRPGFSDPPAPGGAGLAGPPHPLTTRSFWALGLIALALIIPHLWHLFAMSGQSWGAQGAKFAATFFRSNVAVNGPYFFNNREFPLLFTLLGLVGLAACLVRPLAAAAGGERRSLWLMPLWFLLFWGIFLFFYAGSYKYGADVRFALLCFMPLSVLAGLGAEALRKGAEALRGGWGVAPVSCSPIGILLVLLLVLNWLPFLPLVRTVGQEAWGARYDHSHARTFITQIPRRSMVLTQTPTMFLLWGQNAIQAYAGINNPDMIEGLMIRYAGHVYFHRGYWCNTVDAGNRAICEGIAQRYLLEPVAEAREQTYQYGLYRMSKK